jgi:hypothetical protein
MKKVESSALIETIVSARFSRQPTIVSALSLTNDIENHVYKF